MCQNRTQGEDLFCPLVPLKLTRCIQIPFLSAFTTTHTVSYLCVYRWLADVRTHTRLVTKRQRRTHPLSLSCINAWERTIKTGCFDILKICLIRFLFCGAGAGHVIGCENVYLKCDSHISNWSLLVEIFIVVQIIVCYIVFVGTSNWAHWSMTLHSHISFHSRDTIKLVLFFLTFKVICLLFHVHRTCCSLCSLCG